MTPQHLFVNDITDLISANESYNLSLILDQLEKHPLSIAPWEAFPYKPKVAFSIAHAEGFIYLKYYVSEQQIRAVNNATNGSVWEDSCVEFFVNFDDTGYYNLECNAIGTILMCFGAERNNREILPAEVIEKIQFQSTIQNNKEGKTIDWTMTLAIPLSIFTYHPKLSLKGKTCNANFYKCGDKLAEPHFIAWSNIDTPKPDFHRPDFFGRLVFEG
jgi:Carbohydrate-binding family 9